MREENIVKRVKTSLGYPVVDVYMSDEMIKEQVGIALEKFSSSVFKGVILTLPAIEFQELNPDEIALVTQVEPYFPNDKKSSLYVQDEFSLAEAERYFNTRSQSIGTPILAKILRQQMSRVFDSKFDWHYDRTTGGLYLDNVPANISTISVFAKKYYTLEDLPKYAEDWLFEYTLALCKIVEGRIRSKFKDSFPGAPTDGDTLTSEGMSEREALQVSLLDFISYDMGVRY